MLNRKKTFVNCVTTIQEKQTKFARYSLIPYRNIGNNEPRVLNDLGYSNVNGNTRFNESKLDEVRKIIAARNSNVFKQTRLIQGNTQEVNPEPSRLIGRCND